MTRRARPPRRAPVVPGLARLRARSERGAAIIEAAIVLPVLIMVTFGMIEVGMLYTTNSTAGSVARSTARATAIQYASTAKTAQAQATTLADLGNTAASEMRALQFGEPVGMLFYRVAANSADGAPAGMPDSLNSYGCSDCVRFDWDANRRTFVPRQGERWANPQVCAPNIDSFGIYVIVRFNSITPVLGGDRTVKQWTVMRFEPQPTVTCGS